MGLFSRLTKSSGSSSARIQKAVVTPAIATMYADGKIEKAELDQLANLCSFSPIFAHLDGPSFAKFITSTVDEVSSAGVEHAIVEAGRTLSPALRETALCFAARIALADGRVDDNERKALILIGERMGIPEQTFLKVLEVIAMLQRPPTA